MRGLSIYIEDKKWVILIKILAAKASIYRFWFLLLYLLAFCHFAAEG